MTDAPYRDYFLGRATADEAARLEERMLAEDEVYAGMQSAEDELVDDYARGRLSDSERAQFLARGPGQAGRIGFAKALAQRTTGQAASAGPRRASLIRREWMPLAVGATIGLAVGGMWLVRNPMLTTPVPATAPVGAPAGAPARAAVSQPVIISASLALGTDRSAAGAVQVAVPANAAAVRLRVRLDPADRFDGYAVALRSAADQAAWSASDLRATIEGPDLLVVADVPAAVLGDGAYELGVRGTNAGAAPEPLGFVTVEVKRIP